jgi:sialic acid synthase SpsE
MDKIQISDWTIGDGEPCFIIAEIGVNHNGDIELAKRLIDESKKAGANMERDDSQLEMLRELELDYSVFPKLEEYCRTKEIVFLSTPHSYDAIDFLDKLVPAYKIGSGDLTNIPALERIGEKGKPVILSTGMGTMEEISEAIDAIRNQGNQQIILMQCISNYPSNLEDQNLRTINTLRNEFGVLTGFSDHTTGNTASLVAVSLGACVIEKHVTLDRSLPGPDHLASMEPEEFKKLIDLIRDVEVSLGSGIKTPLPIEQEIAAVARKSLVARITIPKDTIITTEMIDIKRPQTGLRPNKLKSIVGKKAKMDIAKDEVITEIMIG